MYSGDAGVAAFAEWAHLAPPLAKLAREDYYPKNNVLPDRIEGIEPLMADAVSFKYIAAPLSPDQLAKLLLVPLQ
jgi:NitT/TauT family transport system substrate-binding protein